jgi:hypothetical protein
MFGSGALAQRYFISNMDLWTNQLTLRTGIGELSDNLVFRISVLNCGDFIDYSEYLVFLKYDCT